MTVYYLLHSIKHKVTFKVGYKAGVFFKLEKTKGKLIDLQLQSLGAIIPPTETAVAAFAKHYEGRITYALIPKPRTVFNQFSDAWFLFYQSYAEITPKFNAIEAKALKQIIVYLRQLSNTDDEALSLWNIVLQHWKQLDEFHQKNTDLKYINSNLNRILNNVKRISKQNNGSVSDDYLQKIMRDLQSQ